MLGLWARHREVAGSVSFPCSELFTYTRVSVTKRYLLMAVIYLGLEKKSCTAYQSCDWADCGNRTSLICSYRKLC